MLWQQLRAANRVARIRHTHRRGFLLLGEGRAVGVLHVESEGIGYPVHEGERLVTDKEPLPGGIGLARHEPGECIAHHPRLVDDRLESVDCDGLLGRGLAPAEEIALVPPFLERDPAALELLCREAQGVPQSPRLTPRAGVLAKLKELHRARGGCAPNPRLEVREVRRREAGPQREQPLGELLARLGEVPLFGEQVIGARPQTVAEGLPEGTPSRAVDRTEDGGVRVGVEVAQDRVREQAGLCRRAVDGLLPLRAGKVAAAGELPCALAAWIEVRRAHEHAAIRDIREPELPCVLSQVLLISRLGVRVLEGLEHAHRPAVAVEHHELLAVPRDGGRAGVCTRSGVHHLGGIELARNAAHLVALEGVALVVPRLEALGVALARLEGAGLMGRQDALRGHDDVLGGHSVARALLADLDEVPAPPRAGRPQTRGWA